jgi:hypothetical protein
MLVRRVFPSYAYGLGIVGFPARNLAKIKLTHHRDLRSALGRASMAHARLHPPSLYGPILSLLRNVDTFTVANTLPNFQTQFWGFISTETRSTQ